ncbi:MAG: PAS domain S-box protein, partial [Alphaproteobacteria bacterium]|nr:PAS domain S-box protein [Alphaproteobacteria bacterium]
MSSERSSVVHGGKRLFEIGDEVHRVLQPDRQPDGVSVAVLPARPRPVHRRADGFHIEGQREALEPTPAVADAEQFERVDEAAARRIFGYHPEELLGRSLVELVLPIQRPELENEFLSMQTTRDTRTRVFSIQHPDGAATWVEVAMRGMHDERDNLREIVTISRDVTERRQAEDERRRLELQFLQTQKLESLGVLAGGIAHDFNNLLVGILGNLDLARGESGLAPAVLGLLGDTERAARQAADLTNQMLAFSGRGSFEVQPVQLSALVQDMRQLLESVVARRARVEYALASDLPCVDADATQLRQVLLN